MNLREYNEKTNYTVVIVSESPKAGIRQVCIERRYIRIGILLTILILGASIGLAACHTVRYKRAKAEAVAAVQKADSLTEENAALASENAELQDKISLVSTTLTKKAKNEAEQAKAEEEQQLPHAFPVSGPAVIVESSENTPKEELAGKDPIVVFTASAGMHIIASGNGTVSSVKEDAEYGFAVTVDHTNGYQSIYRSPSNPVVKEGETVTLGQTIFEVRSDQDRFGYQIMENEKLIDPLKLMQVYG